MKRSVLDSYVMCNSPDQPKVMMASLREDPVTSRTISNANDDINCLCNEFKFSYYV